MEETQIQQEEAGWRYDPNAMFELELNSNASDEE